MEAVNFGGLEEAFTRYEHARVVILPICFDETSTWLKGSDRGPRAIIDASLNIELYDIETGCEVYRQGIHTASEIRPESSESLNKAVHTAVKKHLENGKLVVLLGGEHSISLGAVRAHLDRSKDMSVLHLDAHTDMRDIYEENIYNHACVMARVGELTRNITSVGIRSMDSSELKNIDMKRVFFARDIARHNRWIRRVVEQLSSQVYMSIDLDVFDPGIMPSTGTPEPGGLTWYQVTGLLREVVRKRCIVGFDVVELCPGRNRAPDFLAAKLIYTVLSYIHHYRSDII